LAQARGEAYLSPTVFGYFWNLIRLCVIAHNPGNFSFLTFISSTSFPAVGKGIGRIIMKIRLWFISIILFQLPFNSYAAFGVAPDGHLDTKTLSNAYKESEFEPVRVSIERYLNQRGANATREEKIFAFKFLGVIYAADTLTRIRAESYFNRLLDLAPNIELIDMYVSPKIMEIFERIKNERRQTEAYKEHFDAYGNPIQPVATPTAALPAREKKDPDPKIRKEESNHAWIWWTLGVAAVGAGVGFYALSLDHGSSGDRTVTAGN
jgi:hypothetical protein